MSAISSVEFFERLKTIIAVPCHCRKVTIVAEINEPVFVEWACYAEDSKEAVRQSTGEDTT